MSRNDELVKQKVEKLNQKIYEEIADLHDTIHPIILKLDSLGITFPSLYHTSKSFGNEIVTIFSFNVTPRSGYRLGFTNEEVDINVFIGKDGNDMLSIETSSDKLDVFPVRTLGDTLHYIREVPIVSLLEELEERYVDIPEF